MTERCHDCGRFLAFADLCFSKFHFVPLNEFGPEESWWSCPSCRDDYGGRDSRSSPEWAETGTGSGREATRAAVPKAIAQNPPQLPDNSEI